MWLRSFRAVPARRPNTRISEAENEQIVNAHPKMSFCQWKDVRKGAHFLSRRNLDNVPFVGGDIIITADFGLFAEFKNL